MNDKPDSQSSVANQTAAVLAARLTTGKPTMSDETYQVDTQQHTKCVQLCRDGLRDRIVAAIAKADQDWCSDNPLHEDMADAVIRELGLQQEDGECGYCHAQLPGCRYVTEWKTDE